VVSGTPAEVITSTTLTRIYGSPVEVHYTTDGRLLVVGQPEGAPVGGNGHRAEADQECCEPRR
jgi:zinc/manganese transport system ATP-binding protein